MRAREYKYVLGPDGRTPVVEPDPFRWALWFEGADRARQVALTELPGGVVVSTVFLAVDYHPSREEGDPVLFETLAWSGEEDLAQEQYRTWAQAEAGHAAHVALLRARLG